MICSIVWLVVCSVVVRVELIKLDEFVIVIMVLVIIVLNWF